MLISSEMLLHLNKREGGELEMKLILKCLVLKLLIVSSMVSQINVTGHNLKCLNTQKDFFPKENSL